MSSRRRPRVIRNKGVIAAARVRRVPLPGERLPFQTDPWTRRIVRPLLIAALATAPAIVALTLVTIVTPDQPWLSLSWLCFFAALEGAITAAWLNDPDSRGVDRGTYRLAEVFLLVILSRVVSWALFGSGLPSPDEMRLFLAAPLSVLLTAGFLTTTFITLFAWFLAVTMGRLFAQLDVGADEVTFYTLPLAEQKAQADDRPIVISRGQMQDRFFRLWLFVGMLMVIMTAISSFEVNEFLTVANPLEITRLGLRPAVLFALLVYFLTGLWLLSHTRMLRLNAQWLADGVGKDAALERSWQRDALLLVLLIALIAAFLPIGSTLGISQILTVVINGILYVVSLVYAAIGYLFASMLALLTRNVDQQTPLPTPAPAPTLAPPPVAAPPPTPNPTLAFVATSAFWALLIALAIGALVFFLRERGYKLQRSQVERAMTSLSAAARDWWRRLRRRARRTRLALRARLRRPDDPVTGPPLPARRSPRRQGSMSPREQVRYYYLATVQRAQERGVTRAENETPLEYVSDLKAQWPEAEAEFDDLTQAFVEARYSPQPVERPAMQRAKDLWERIRERLRSSTRRE